MVGWFFIFAGFYLLGLIYSAYKSEKMMKEEKDYILPRVGIFLGFLTYSATLFSTFTLMGMPNFFRVHGVGSWIFLGVTDTAMGVMLILFGVFLRKRFSKDNFHNVSTLIEDAYGSRFASYVYKVGIFIFLLPYTAIQIKGIADFLHYAIFGIFPVGTIGVFFLFIILVYSYVGGMRAIVISDAIQGILLLIASFVVAYTCISHIGGIKTMFEVIANEKPSLLSVPGPKGLLTVQFLLSSFIVILLMPISQPQLFTRIVMMDSIKSLRIMAIAFSVFAFLVILPTVFIGFYGVLMYPDAPTKEFLYKTLVRDQAPIIGALSLIGLIAAAMSTADSQLFAVQTEMVKTSYGNIKSKLLIFLFGFIALLLAIYSRKELVLLARISFAGTSLLAPMIFLAILRRGISSFFPVLTAISLLVYLLSNFSHFIPKNVLFLRLDIFLLLVNTIIGVILYFMGNNRSRELAGIEREKEV